MEVLIERLPEIITAAAQSQLGILALLCVALSVLAYAFFAKASEMVRVVIFVLLFLGVLGFGAAMFRASSDGSKAPQPVASTPELSEKAKIVLKEAAADPSGQVLFEYFGTHVDLHAASGESLFTDKGDHRALAAWESAVQELVDVGLLARENDEMFEITKKGYDSTEQMD